MYRGSAKRKIRRERAREDKGIRKTGEKKAYGEGYGIEGVGR